MPDFSSLIRHIDRNCDGIGRHLRDYHIHHGTMSNCVIVEHVDVSRFRMWFFHDLQVQPIS